MDLDTIEHETATGPRAAVIVLHGLGADGNDFVPVADELDLDAANPRTAMRELPSGALTLTEARASVAVSSSIDSRRFMSDPWGGARDAAIRAPPIAHKVKS